MTFWAHLKINAINPMAMMAVVGLGAMMVATLWR
jgi:hypothetical protein